MKRVQFINSHLKKKKEKATVKSVIILKFCFLTLFKLWNPFKSEITFLVTKKTSY